MTCGIYQIKNTVNGKSYIGLSRNIERRWREHTRGLDRADALERGNYRLRADFLKYRLKTVVSTPGKFGVFEFKIIEKCREDKLLEREQFWIKKIKPVYNCIPWTTERERIIVGSEQKFWVQYHNYDRLGYVPADSLLEEYLDDEEYEYECEDVVPCVSTNKRAILNARGDTLFLIVGIGQNPKQYYLWSVFVIEEVEIIDEEGEYSYNAFGNGWVLDSPKLLNSASFNEFKSLCGNFGFGFMSINNFHYLEKLKHFSGNYKPKTSKINFLKYVYNFYQQVIRVNPNEAARLFGDVEN